MRICLLAAKIDTNGGGGRHLHNVVTALRSAGHAVEMIEYANNFWHYVRIARRHARNADIVQVVDMRNIAFAGFLATRFTSAKFVVVAQGTYAVAPLYSVKRALLARLVYRSADAVVAISKFTREEILKKVPGLHITVIDPGIDLSNFTPSGRIRTSAITDSPLLLGVGTVKARKGYLIALRSFARLKKEFPGLRYCIVGPQTDEPKYVQSLKNTAKELGVEKDVQMRASISDSELKALYEEAAIFILTSINEGLHFEGYGMVFLEAAAHGLPSVGTRGNGIEDAVEDGKTGFLVPQKDVVATATALREILTDTKLAERMSARATEFAHEHDLTHLARTYENLYRTISE